ncbi:hypothetical protein V6N13_033768 [Hibiscus sabdariffa]
MNLPLVEALQQMLNYAKFLKDMVSRKKRIREFETAVATETCLALMHNKLPTKKADPESFTIECYIGHNYSTKALCDPGASINLMSKFVFKKLGIGKAKPTKVMLQLADHSFIQPEGKIEDILVRIEKIIFPADFLILDCEADENAPIILGRPFLATGRVLLDFGNDELILRVDDQQIKIEIHRTNKYGAEAKDCEMVQITLEFKFEQTICPGRKETSNTEALTQIKLKPRLIQKQVIGCSFGQVTTRLLLHPKINPRPPSPARTKPLPSEECHLGYAMHLPHSNDA